MPRAFGLLDMALSVIPAVPVVYFRRAAEVLDTQGRLIGQYTDGVTIRNAHVQGVESSLYAQLGLQLGVNYRKVFIPADAANVSDAAGSDVLEFYGKRWTVVNVIQWYEYDGWNQLIVAEDKNYSNGFQG